MTTADLIIYNAAQLITCAADDGPKRGAAMQDLGLIADGAVAIRGQEILAVGTGAQIRAAYTAREQIDAGGRVVCPGFVDPHTHVVYAGDRAHEFEMRIAGATYLEILAAGGGILSTMQAVRQAPLEHLVAESRRRLDTMLALGTTTVEVKTGYGLSTEAELKMLHAIEELDRTHPCDLVPTFLAAHTTPPEYGDDADAYVDLVIREMLPRALDWYAHSVFASGRPFFIDVFCEDHAFDVEQSHRVLAAGKDAGMGVKIHSDQFNSLGGTAVAVELGATSIDHLDAIAAEDIARVAASQAVAVPLPAANFNLGQTNFAPARGLIDAGAALALATDINPGSAPCPSLPLVMAIACRYQRLLPSEALNAVTINAAHAVGMGHRLGSLQPGKQADLLILDMPDYRHLTYQFGANPVWRVIKSGRVVV
ncbi:MAG: imidazolonepropionase [Caldilineae bacterium]|nr:MAG: imidazolonepropionase [Caldilineae bacterium]